MLALPRSWNGFTTICVIKMQSALLDRAFDNLVRGNINDFVKLLETFNKTRALRSFFSANEAMLQSIVELILDKPSYRVPELRLVVDGNKEKGKGCYGFADLFIPATTRTNGTRTYAELLELKYITLNGLLKGEVNNWHRPSAYSDMEDLAKRLSGDNDDEILRRNYMYWSKDLGRPVTKTVGSILADGVEQLNMYMETIAKGETNNWNNSGILDKRIKVEDGNDFLQGHVVMGIGRGRILVRSTQPTLTSKEYDRI